MDLEYEPINIPSPGFIISVVSTHTLSPDPNGFTLVTVAILSS